MRRGDNGKVGAPSRVARQPREVLAGSADSWESLLIFYFGTPQDDWGLLWNHLPGVRGQYEKVKESLHTCSTIIHTGATAEERWRARTNSISPLGLVHMYAYAAACASSPKVMLGKCVRGRRGDQQRIFGALPHKWSSAELQVSLISLITALVGLLQS